MKQITMLTEVLRKILLEKHDIYRDDFANEIRVSEEELNFYKYLANRCNMSLADWARNRLNENRDFIENAPVLVQIISNMQTNINKIYAGIDTGEQLYELQEGVNKLWQFLKK